MATLSCGFSMASDIYLGIIFTAFGAATNPLYAISQLVERHLWREIGSQMKLIRFAITLC